MLDFSSGEKVYFYSDYFCVCCCLKFQWDCGSFDWLREENFLVEDKRVIFFNKFFFLIKKFLNNF